jgi:DNA-binding NarL/FixJ family response regulator
MARDVMTIRLLLVDDHRLVRAGLRSLLDGADGIEVVGEAADGATAVRLVAEQAPDVVLMDLSMPGMDGIAATAAIRAAGGSSRVLVLTSFIEADKVQQAVAAGAIGYALKDSEPGQLITAIRAAAAGQTPLDPRIAAALLPGTGSERPPELSAREREVLLLASTGMPNKQIARSLGIAERTVKAHLGNVYRTIGVTDRTSAALWARDHLPESS